MSLGALFKAHPAKKWILNKLKTLAQLHQFILKNRHNFNQVTPLTQSKNTVAFKTDFFKLDNQKKVFANIVLTKDDDLVKATIDFQDARNDIGTAKFLLNADKAVLNWIKIFNAADRKTELRPLSDLLGLQLAQAVSSRVRHLDMESLNGAVPAHYKAGYRFTRLPADEVNKTRKIVTSLNQGTHISQNELLDAWSFWPTMRLSPRIIKHYNTFPSLLSTTVKTDLKKLSFEK
jgi:hypothetical protein